MIIGQRRIKYYNFSLTLKYDLQCESDDVQLLIFVKTHTSGVIKLLMFY